jgi:acyl CoA:acetate/3-ketoacid CoA transferase beta subunit
MLITDLCVMEFDEKRSRFVLTEVAPGVTVDEVKAKTEAEFLVGGKVEMVET